MYVFSFTSSQFSTGQVGNCKEKTTILCASMSIIYLCQFREI